MEMSKNETTQLAHRTHDSVGSAGQILEMSIKSCVSDKVGEGNARKSKGQDLGNGWSKTGDRAGNILNLIALSKGIRAHSAMMS